jgi:type I restriction enzyme S subunit
MRHIKKESLGEKIYVPSVFDQGLIATFLDRETAKIDALIAEQKRLIELLQEKRQAVISHAVTKGLNPDAPMKDSGVEWLGEVPEHWGVTQLRHFTRSLPGFAFPSEGFIQDESKWKLLRGVNVGVSCIRWDDTVYWDRQVDDRLDQYVLSPGDLVVGLDRPMIKDGLRVARIAREDCPCMLLQRVAAIKGTKNLSTDYLFFLLSSPCFLAHFEPETTGVSVPHISTGQIDSFVVPIPPLQEQSDVVAFLSAELSTIRQLIEESSRSISLLQERRSALISAAVTGQIDVRGLAPEANAA